MLAAFIGYPFMPWDSLMCRPSLYIPSLLSRLPVLPLPRVRRLLAHTPLLPLICYNTPLCPRNLRTFTTNDPLLSNRTGIIQKDCPDS